MMRVTDEQEALVITTRDYIKYGFQAELSGFIEFYCKFDPLIRQFFILPRKSPNTNSTSEHPTVILAPVIFHSISLGFSLL